MHLRELSDAVDNWVLATNSMMKQVCRAFLIAVPLVLAPGFLILLGIWYPWISVPLLIIATIALIVWTVLPDRRE